MSNMKPTDTNFKLMSIDFETYRIGEDAYYPKPVCLSYYDGINKGLIGGGDPYLTDFLEEILSKKTVIAHNASFECGVIYTWFPHLRPLLLKAIEEDRIVCTKIKEDLIDNCRENQRKKSNLANLVLHYFQTDISDTKTEDAWRLNYDKLDNVPLNKWPKDAREYAINDSIWAYKIYFRQHKVPGEQLSTKAAIYLNLTAAKGLHINTERVQILETEIYEHLEKHYELLIKNNICYKEEGQKRPKNNMNNLREYIKNNVERPRYTKKKNIQSTKEALFYYLGIKEDPILRSFMEVASYDKILTAYISRLKGNKIIRTQYSTTKSTGRTSSSSSKLYPSVNIQQMPREVKGVTWDIRNCFIPRPGFKLVSIDYSGLELTAAADRLYKLNKYSSLRDKINYGNEPVDLHSILGAKLMSSDLGRIVTYQEFLDHKKDKAYADYRQLAKPINLGFPGGIGYSTMRGIIAKAGLQVKYEIVTSFKTRKEAQYQLFKAKSKSKAGELNNFRVERTGKAEYSIVYDEMVKLKRNFLELYPELERFLTLSHKKFLDGTKSKLVFDKDFSEWVEEPMYKYKTDSFERRWVTYTAFCNSYLMQEPSATGAKKMCNKVINKYIENPNMNFLAFIHDEVLFEVKDDENKYKIVDDVAELMIDYMGKELSTVRIAVEATIMDYWSKSGGEWSKVYWKDHGSIQLQSK